MASQAKPLFNAAVRAVLSGPGWRAWWPSHPPWPPTDGEECQHGDLHWRHLNATHEMCLARDDYRALHALYPTCDGCSKNTGEPK